MLYKSKVAVFKTMFYLLTLVTEKDLDKQGLFCWLAWRDAFRTFDWVGLYSNLGFHLENTNKLLSLAN